MAGCPARRLAARLDICYDSSWCADAAFPPAAAMTVESLDRFIARRRKWTWAAARLAIHQRRVQVDGLRTNRYHHPCAADSVVTIDGAQLHDGTDDGVLLCHKPPGVACSHQREHRPLLYDLVPAELKHPDLQSAGRLDRDTTGLLVLTIDGPLIQRLTSPRWRCAKRYRLSYAGTLAADAVAQVRQGLVLPDEPRPCLPAALAIAAGDGAGGHATLTLCEGRTHQVKRMIRALGGTVVALHRDCIGGLALPADLALGAMRPATPAERAQLVGAALGATPDSPLGPCAVHHQPMKDA